MLSYLYASCIFSSASPTNSLLSLLPLNKKKKTTHRTVYNRIWDETHNQSRSECHHNTSLNLAPSCLLHHHKTLTCKWAYSHSLNNCITAHQQGTQHCSFYSLLHTWQLSAMFSSDKSSQHISHSNIPYRLSNGHAPHTFCIQDRAYLPCSVAVTLHPPTT